MTDRTSEFEVVEVGPAEAKAAADAASRGFQDNEIWAWILPNDRTRARVEKRQYRSLVKHIFVPRRAAWMTRPRSDSQDGGRRRTDKASANGAALWFPPGTKKMTGREMLAESLPFMPEGLPKLARVGRLDTAMKAHQPKEPHWYLSVLSVEPACQGQGHGSALIQPGLDRADEAGSGAYLETQRETNIGFYERFGFELIEKLMIDGELPVWLMWREGKSGSIRPATADAARAEADASTRPAT